MALIHRKRSLIAAAVQMVKKHRQQHSLSAWMRYTYYKHIGHVALHFRVRRLACVVLREWQEVGSLVLETTGNEAGSPVSICELGCCHCQPVTSCCLMSCDCMMHVASASGMMHVASASPASAWYSSN